MAEFPALPLWTDAYLGDTTHLNATEHGAYLLLLIVAWRSESTTLPDDDALLARYARCGLKMWTKLRPTIAPFFQIADGRWTQLRLLEEKLDVIRRKDAAAANGRASALKRKGRHSTKRPTEREQSDQRTGNELPTTISSNTLPNGKGGGAPPDPAKELFDSGVALLTAAGASDRQARGLVAKWRKNHGDDWTRQAIASAQDKTDPTGWIERRAKTAASASDDAAALRRATLDLYSTMPGPPARKREATNAG